MVKTGGYTQNRGNGIEQWLAVGGGWRLAAVGGWRLAAVGGWRLAAVGGWRLAVGGPWGLSVTKTKLGFLRTALPPPLFLPPSFFPSLSLSLPPVRIAVAVASPVVDGCGRWWWVGSTPSLTGRGVI